MTFHDHLDRLGGSARTFARMSGIKHSTARVWVRGHDARGKPRPAPPEVLAWLDRVWDALQGVPGV